MSAMSSSGVLDSEIRGDESDWVTFSSGLLDFSATPNYPDSYVRPVARFSSSTPTVREDG